MLCTIRLVDKGLDLGDALALLSAENAAQLAKWGNQRHNIFEWLAIMTEEVGELSSAMLAHAFGGCALQDVVEEATQVATVALKIAWMGRLAMWQDLVDREDRWIGGTLIDYGDSADRALGLNKNGPLTTTITGFELTDTHFTVKGKAFNCGGSRECVGIIPGAPGNGLALGGYGGHKFHIVQPTGVGNDNA